jgi:hypothetical protein
MMESIMEVVKMGSRDVGKGKPIPKMDHIEYTVVQSQPGINANEPVCHNIERTTDPAKATKGLDSIELAGLKWHSP